MLEHESSEKGLLMSEHYFCPQKQFKCSLCSIGVSLEEYTAFKAKTGFTLWKMFFLLKLKLTWQPLFLGLKTHSNKNGLRSELPSGSKRLESSNIT